MGNESTDDLLCDTVLGDTVLGDIDVMVLLRHVTERLLAIEADAPDDATLHQLVVELHTERSKFAVAYAELLAHWDTRRLWESDGSRSPAHRLARETRSSVGSARDDLRRARRIRHLPATRDAVANGHLSIDHIDLAGHVNTPRRRHLFTRDEELLVRTCSHLSYADGARAIRYWATRADDTLTDERTAGDQADSRPTDPDHAPDDANAPPDPQPDPASPDHNGADHNDNDNDPDHGHDSDRSSTGSRLHASRTLDDTLVIDGTLDAIDGTIVERELNRLTDEIRLADRAKGIQRTPAQRRAAALVEMARRSATAPAHGRRPRPLFTVLIGEQSFDRLSELSNGIVVTPTQRVVHLGEAEIESVLFDGPSTVVAVSSRRTFDGAVRRAIQVRDRRCTHPSVCDVPADDCDLDHITPHAKGGPTSQFNGRLECKAHNRFPHLHDHDATPRQHRELTRLDELRARIRWRCRHDDWYANPPDMA